MSLPLINEIWKLLKPSIELGDTSDAADNLINYLVEEDYSPAEIKQVFRGDIDIKKALEFFLESPEDAFNHTETFDEDEDPYDDYHDDDDDNDYYR